MGLFKSQSTNIVFLFKSREMTCDKLIALDVFPSPIIALATTTTMLFCLATMSPSLVAATLNCSATADRGYHMATASGATMTAVRLDTRDRSFGDVRDNNRFLLEARHEDAF